jgi:hypothetical protein
MKRIELTNETAEVLARIELKLDAILIKLEWTPRSEAQWYAQDGAQQDADADDDRQAAEPRA